jgi:hypothetical protein
MKTIQLSMRASRIARRAVLADQSKRDDIDTA